MIYGLELGNGRQSPEQFIALLQEMYHQGSTSPLEEHCTRQLLATFQRELDVLRRFGLRKEIHYGNHKGYDAQSTHNIKDFRDGKYAQANSFLFNSYQENYYDAKEQLVKTLQFNHVQTRLVSIKTREA